MIWNEELMYEETPNFEAMSEAELAAFKSKLLKSAGIRRLADSDKIDFEKRVDSLQEIFPELNRKMIRKICIDGDRRLINMLGNQHEFLFHSGTKDRRVRMRIFREMPWRNYLKYTKKLYIIASILKNQILNNFGKI